MKRKIKTLKELRQCASKTLSRMDAYYGCEVMYGRITLARNLLSELYKQNIPLDTKVELVQKLINITDYENGKQFKITD